MIAHASTPLLEAIVIAVMVLVSGVIVQLVVDARMTSTSVRIVARPRIERAAWASKKIAVLSFLP